MKKTICSLVLIAGVAFATNARAAGFKIIVNNSVHVSSISRKALSDVFMKRMAKWESGADVAPVDQADPSVVRDEFSRSVHGKPTAAVKSYWNQQIFSGRDVPPIEKRTDTEVLAFVRSTPGAVGYVSDAAATDGVRVLPVE